METNNYEGISHQCLRSGQKGPYQDSESVYKITIEEGKQLMDSVIYEYKEGRNTLTLVKKINPKDNE